MFDTDYDIIDSNEDESRDDKDFKDESETDHIILENLDQPESQL